MSTDPPPDVPLRATDEALLAEFTPDPAVYTRDHAWLGLLGAALFALAFWAVWAPAGFLGPPLAITAVTLRHKRAAPRDLAEHWQLTDRRLAAADGREIPLDRISGLRCLGSAVQVSTRDGGRHLIRFQRDPRGTRAAIRTAIG